MSGKDLVERLYSEGYQIEFLEQREFGLKSKAISVIKKVGKLAGNSLEKWAEADRIKANKIIQETNSYKSKSPKVLKYLGKESKKLGAKIIKGNKSNSIINQSSTWQRKSSNVSSSIKNRLTKSNNKKERKLGKALIDNEYVINIPSGKSQAALAHEIGHVKNIYGKYTEKISELNDKVRKVYRDRRNLRVGFKNAIKSFKEGNILVKEEKNANKNAMKLLKSAGASKEELKDAKKELNLGVKSYRLGRNEFTKRAIAKRLKGRKVYG